MTPPLRHIHVLHALALMLAIVAVGFWSMDELTKPAEVGDVVVEPVPLEEFHGGSRRVFLLILDSLPWRVATDPERMPNLVELMERSAVGKMETVHDAVSVPAMRAAFTGRDRVAVFGFVKNLWHGEEGFESIFTQTTEAGLSSLVYSDGTFRQFGKALPDQRDIGHGLEEELANIEEGRQAYVDGEYDVVVMHVLFTDTIGHLVGVHSDKYREEYAIADDLVKSIGESIPEEDTFIVMGDHGHDDLGRHLPGMDVPTIAVMRGPGFAPGARLDDLHIQDLRYLLSWGMKLTPPATVGGRRHPNALAAPGPLPKVFDERPDGAGRPTPPRRTAEFFGSVATIVFLVVMWTRLLRPQPRMPIFTMATSWIAVVILTIGAATLVPVLAALLVALMGTFVPCLGRTGAALERRWLVVPIAAALLVPWGMALSALQTEIGWPRHVTVTLCWIVAIAIGAVASLRVGAVRAAVGLMIAAFFLLPPTVYHYGLPSAMAPLWGALLIYVAISAWRRGASRRDIALMLPIGLLLLPFALVFSTNFQFEEWFVPVVKQIWWRRQEQDAHMLAIATAVVAKCVFFIPWRGGRAAQVTGLLAVGIASYVQWRWTNLTPEFMPRHAYLIAIATGLVLIAVVRRPEGAWRGVRQVIVISTMYAAYYYLLRIDYKFYLWHDCLLAALFLTARYLDRLVDKDERGAAKCCLLVLAAMVATWVSSGWTFHRLEWGFMFDWFSVRFVEKTVGVFGLLIAARFCLPLFMARYVLRRALPDGWVYPQRSITIVAGLTTFATLLVAMGMAFHLAGSDAYLEAVQETAIWSFVVVALPWAGRRPDAADGEGA